MKNLQSQIFRGFFLVAIILIAITKADAQATSDQSGNWSNDCTWGQFLLICIGEVPILGDNVDIGSSHDVVVNGNYQCNNLTLNDDASISSLSIPAGNSLIVNGDLTLLNNTLTTAGDLEASIKNDIEVLGSLTVKGNLIFQNSSYYDGATVKISQVLFSIGNETNAGTVTVEGDIVMTSPESHATTLFNQLVLYNGELNLDGDLILGTASEAAANGINSVLVSDAYAVTKTLNFSKTNPVIKYQGTIFTFNETGGQSDCVFNFTGAGNQTLNLASSFEYGKVNFPNADTILVSEASSASQILDTLSILSGQVLELNTAGVNLDSAAVATGFRLNLESGSTLLLKDAACADGIPANKVLAHANSTIVYEISTGNTYDVLTEELGVTTTKYPLVKLKGVGTKYYSSNSLVFNASTIEVAHIDLEEGVLAFEEGVDFTMTDSYGDKTLTASANTTIQIEGDFTYDFYIDLPRNSTVEYNKENGASSVYSFTSDGSTVKPYGKLLLTTATGTATRNVAADVRIEKSLELGVNVELAINNGGTTTLLADNTYTAYMKEVPASASISYSGTGEFVVQKYLNTDGDYSSVDLTSPIKNITINDWASKITLRGFPGSSNPNSYANIVRYAEDSIGVSSEGFTPPVDISETVYGYNGANITRNAYRHNLGTSSRSLADAGEVNYGDQTFELSFTYSGDTVVNARTNHDGWHVIGNPFPCAISWEKIVADPDNAALFSAGSIDEVLYTYKYNDRENYDPAASTPYGYYNSATNFEYAQDSIIPAHQAFLVKTYHATSENETFLLTIKESHKVDYEIASNFKAAEANSKKSALGVYLEGTFNVEPIWIHPWAKATVKIDEEYDVRRTSSLNPSWSWINFSGDSVNNEVQNALNLYVNAIPDNKLSTSVKLLANVTKVQQYTLRFSNLEAFANSAYSCFTLEHEETGVIRDLNMDSIYVFTADSIGQQHFTIHFSPDLSKRIETTEIACYGESNGSIVFDAPYVMTNETFSLYKNVAFVEQYTGASFTVEDLDAGTYSIVSDSILMTCSSNAWEYTLVEPEQLVGAIEIAGTEFTVGDTVLLNLTGTNGAFFTWMVKDTSYEGASANHIITDTLTQVSMFVENETRACLLELDTVFTAEEKSGVSVVEQAKQLSFAYEILGDELLLHNLNGAMKVEYYSMQGKLLQIESTGLNKPVKVPILKGATLMKLSNEATLEHELTLKVFLK